VSAWLHRSAQTNGIRMHFVEQGSGPVVLLCHGFPESWYSWRHQLAALADAGYRAIAPDMRGYGQTDRPHSPEQYTMSHLVGDLVGLLDALEVPSCVVAGHDWGAPVAWNAALMRPDRFRAIAALSVPYSPRGSVPPTLAMRKAAGENFFYMLYFQRPGVPEAETERDVAATLRAVYYSVSGEGAPKRRGRTFPKSSNWLETLLQPERLPSWLTQADFDFYVAEFTRTGFGGGLNWYRAIDRSWELLAPFQHARIAVPALYIAGAEDPVLRRYQAAADSLRQSVPGLTESLVLPGCGHWTQQERPAEVNAALLRFLSAIPAGKARARAG
jgi:pimeloyl-ACP methyl ester carboxylesterase